MVAFFREVSLGTNTENMGGSGLETQL
jgi:hypothetical protein